MKFIFSCSKPISHSFAALTRELSIWTLEDKFHISAQQCIILYLRTKAVILPVRPLSLVSLYRRRILHWVGIEWVRHVRIGKLLSVVAHSFYQLLTILNTLYDQTDNRLKKKQNVIFSIMIK